jgi:thioredoxin-dependent peroxiredoxin
MAAVLSDPGAPTKGAVVEEGRPAPDFTLTSDSGEEVTLSSFRGAPVVLYFYPKDDTPGCTKQACGFRDAYREYQERGAVVLGVSPDDTGSHRKFKEKYGLPFTLLADPGHDVADAFGAWGEKQYAGKTYMGIIRSTFVIDPEGNVARAMYGVNAERNPAEVLEALP